MPRDAADLSPDLRVTGRDGGVALHCARCGGRITHADQAFAANGAHEHVVFNPAGMVFRVACFHDAPGVQTVGEASGEFSWFKGYAWRIAQCRACGIHLGWRYDGAQTPLVFFGLIRTMLTERPE